MAARIKPIVALAAAMTLAGCNDWQSALSPRGVPASDIHWLLLIFSVVAAIIWTAVMLALLYALIRRKELRLDPLDVSPRRERSIGQIILTLAVATVVIVLALSIVSYLGQRTVFAKAANAPVVRVIGHQWWWEVKYEGPPDQSFTTANEIRVPVGEPVTVKLETRDVIHSFWVPNLAGKMDQINGQENEIQFTATKEGVYRGQCAEFCGLQHAHMGFDVVALSRADYDQWRAAQLKSAQVSSDPQIQSGELIFRGRGCALCHTISGTQAGGRLGPDLTHLASRTSVASSTLPMTPGNLAGWISDPQHIKPGNLMPAVPLDGRELSALVHFLWSLK
jgi:cytochrome c oxidase subunit 2